jgi:hypothetical protein
MRHSSVKNLLTVSTIGSTLRALVSAVACVVMVVTAILLLGCLGHSALLHVFLVAITTMQAVLEQLRGPRER